MKSTAFALLLLAAVTCGTAQNGSIVDFYRYADSISTYPPVDQQLAIIQQQKVMNGYVSFIGIKGTSIVILAAVTTEKLTDPKSISLTVEFLKDRASIGKVPMWGYVFDRNNDGKVDYMALVEGAAPYKDKDFPEDYPLRKKPATQEQMERFVNDCKLVFNHYADDNFDGKVDAFVHIDLDPKRDWVERQIVARCTAFDEKFNDVWAFRLSMKNPPEQVAHTAENIPFHPLNKPTDVLTKATLADRTSILEYLNTAAGQARLKWFNFQHPKKKNE